MTLGVDLQCLVQMHQFFKFFHWQRTSKQETLVGIAILLCQKLTLLFSFHALGNDIELQFFCQRDNGTGNNGIVVVDQNICHEGLVYFQLIQGQTFKEGQR